ncbi:hypothetical protein [Psychromonas ingrahamii]|uniref:hypothetical protein n=1 Tax=Psychromonas ingrahamii TaxID=357794 RepID=UPI00031DA55D|nr:hypothetical protein [Psychromonas ingrahamii]
MKKWHFCIAPRYRDTKIARFPDYYLNKNGFFIEAVFISSIKFLIPTSALFLQYVKVDDFLSASTIVEEVTFICYKDTL